MADVIKILQAPSTICSFLGKWNYPHNSLGGSMHNPLQPLSRQQLDIYILSYQTCTLA